ncbi:hypothetical protein GCM10011332_32220 [Terasakiella brassicae]|uniref:Uncharacterized protein n=2 Tax=Terasakiella brassicae TaxID=1634917 RepID=A0A917C9W7_9PROT|nr:hypothetical protein GCM10011332_32220 [Terasakiella brassicae]
MIIKMDKDAPLFEQTLTFLRANEFIMDAADLSRAMGRSRSYIGCLRYSGHDASNNSYINLKAFLQECLTETTDTDLQRCLTTYINLITNEVLA